MDTHAQMLHVWNIDLHSGHIFGVNVGLNKIIHGASGMYQKEIDLKYMGLSMGLSPSQIIQNLIRAFHKYHLLRGTPYDYGNSHIKTIVIGP